MLTRDQILAMTPDELNRSIWMAQGWRKLSKSAWPQEWEKCLDNGSLIGWYNDIPDYTGRISAAWGLVEEMRSSDNVEVYIDAMHNHFGVHVFDNSQYVDENALDLLAEAHGFTAPLAIARAWLIWHNEVSNVSA
jgi:hypothetical protein